MQSVVLRSTGEPDQGHREENHPEQRARRRRPGPVEHRVQQYLCLYPRCPRRPRVQHLEEEGRHPRRERKGRGGHRRQRRTRRTAVARAPTRLHGQEHRNRSDQQERPVVGVDQRRGGNREYHQPATRGLLKRPDERQPEQQHQQDDERVHPGLAAVPDRVGRAREQQERRRPHPPGGAGVTAAGRRRDAPDAAAGDPGDRQRGQRQQARQRPDRHVTGSEQPDPSVQQQVVQGRRTVVPQSVEQPTDRSAGDVDGQ